MIYDTMDSAVTTMGNAEGVLLVGRYRIVRRLGNGNMGDVWLAEDTQLDNKQFAIKMLPSILVANKRAYRQLKDEALVAMKLTHPNIVTLRAFEENNDNPFLVMDYIDGQTLDDYLAEKGKLSEDESIRVLRPIAAALDYAHSKGVVHRDVKPGNVMIAKDGTPYILDFGIAREIQETMTRVTGKLSSGTLLYMSPEQLMGDKPTPAQDIYSFAAMAYECLNGEPPFVRGAIEDQIRNKQPEPLPGGTSFCSSVMSGLAKKLGDRPAMCAEVLGGNGFSRVEHVERVEVGTGSARSPSGPQPGGLRSHATVAILFAALLIILGGAWWVLGRTGNLHTTVSFSGGRNVISNNVNVVSNKVVSLGTNATQSGETPHSPELKISNSVKKFGKGTTAGKPLTNIDIKKMLEQGYRYGARNQLEMNEAQRCMSLIKMAILREWNKESFKWESGLQPIHVNLQLEEGGVVRGYTIKSGSGNVDVDRTVRNALNRLLESGRIDGLSEAFVKRYSEVLIVMEPQSPH